MKRKKSAAVTAVLAWVIISAGTIAVMAETMDDVTTASEASAEEIMVETDGEEAPEVQPAVEPAMESTAEPAGEEDMVNERAEEAVPEEKGEATAVPEASCRVRVITEGRGKVTLEGDVWRYEPEEGYELLYIEADRTVLDYDAGEAIPEAELAASAVSDGTTLTYVFAEEADWDTGSYDVPGSAEARFDGVWDPATQTVH